MDDTSNLAIIALFSASLSLLVVAIIRLIRGESLVYGDLDGSAERNRRRAGLGSGAPLPPRRANAPIVNPSPAVAADLERRFAAVFASVPAQQRDDLICGALMRLRTDDRITAMAHLVSDRARAR